MKKYIIIALFLLLLFPINTLAYEKHETVYINLNSNGEVIESKVNNHLKYTPKEEIEDETILKNILNISGNEKYTLNNNKITFKANGKDITYQGTTDKKLPITANIKYYLDDKEISRKDLIGKSGNVKININFKNNSYNNKYNMYTPFVVTTVTMINNDNNTNIEINNGKVVNTGTKNILVGISTPDLYNDIELDELKDMNNIEISFNTTKYKYNDIYFAATPKLLDDLDLSVFNKLDNLDNSMNELSNGVNQLVDGSNKLVDGTTLLSEKLEVAVNGSKEISNGLNELNNNMSSISDLTTLVNTLYSKYNENNELLSKINDGTIANELKYGIEDATNKMNDLVEKKATYDYLKSLVEQGVELPEEQLAIYNQLNENIDSITTGIEQYKKGIEEAQKQLANLPTSAAALTGSNQTIELILKNILKIDSMEYAPQAIEIFNSNINKLVDGVSELNNGQKELTNGLNQLKDGSNELKNGTLALRDGMNKFNNEGISKIKNVANKIKTYKNKANSIIELSNEYKGYSSNNAKESVFIYKVK